MKSNPSPSAPLNLCPPVGVSGTTLPDSPVRDVPISLPVHPVSSHLNSLPGFDGFERATYQTLTKAQALVVLPKMRILEPLPKKGNAIIANTPGGEFPLVRVTLTPGRSTDGKSPLYALEFFRRVSASPVKDTPTNDPIGSVILPASPVDSVGVLPLPLVAEGVDIYGKSPANVRPHIARVIYGDGSAARAIVEACNAHASHAAKDAKIKALTDALEASNSAMLRCQNGEDGEDWDPIILDNEAALALPCA